MEKEIVIFGTGSYANSKFGSLRHANIKYCVDNDSSKWGGEFNGYPIKSPRELCSKPEDLLILICSTYYPAISRQLEGYGFKKNVHFMHVRDYVNNDEYFYRDDRKKVLLYGNCQLPFLTQYLRSSELFNQTYVVYDKAFINDFSPDYWSDKLLSEIDLFIYQKVSPSYLGEQMSTDYILKCLSPKCETLSIPNSYFQGYFPQHISKRSPYGRFPYGDRNIIEAIYDSKFSEGELQDLVRMLGNNDYYSSEELEKNTESSLEELAQRESGLDVIISDYIKENYKDKYLFYTVNHPTYWVIREVATRVLKLLDIYNTNINPLVIDSLNDLVVPIYPSVIKQLGLGFIDRSHKYPFHISTDGLSYTFEEYMLDYARSYLQWGFNN